MLYRNRHIDLPHGKLETPTLFPVRNIGSRSSDNTPEYATKIPDLRTAMVNSHAIRKREPQWKRLKNGAEIREEMGSPKDTFLFADSGGYDFTDKEIDVTPQETLETQRELEADIFGTLDIPINRENREVKNQERIERSIELALEASDRHRGKEKLFASVHGYDPNTIRNSIQHLETEGDFDGFALGSLVPIRSDYKKVTKLIIAARNSTEKHLHVYGLGGLVYQPLLLYLGVDSFDSSAFIRSAGNRNYLIPGMGGEELHNISEMEFLPCPCPICGARTLDSVKKDRNALAVHNLWALTTELRTFRYIAASGKNIEDYLDLRFQGNDVTKRAFETAKQQVRRLT